MTSLELFMALGDISPENLSEAEKLQIQAPEKRRRPGNRLLLVAAVAALLALLATACAVAYSRIHMKLVQHNPTAVTQTISERRATEAAETTEAAPNVLTSLYPQQLPEGYRLGDGAPIGYSSRNIRYDNGEGNGITFSLSTYQDPEIALAPPVEETQLKVSGWDAVLQVSDKDAQVLKWHDDDKGCYMGLFTQDMDVDLTAIGESVTFGGELPLSFLCKEGQLWDVWYPQQLPDGYACTDVSPAGLGMQSIGFTNGAGNVISYRVSLRDDLRDLYAPSQDACTREEGTVGGQKAEMMTTASGERLLFWKNEEEGFNAMLETEDETVDLTAMAEGVAPGEPLQVTKNYLGPDYTIELEQEPMNYVGWEPVYPQAVPEGYTITYVSERAYGQQEVVYENNAGERLDYILYFRLGQWGRQFDGMGQPETVSIHGKTGYHMGNKLIWTDETRGFGFSLETSGEVDLIAIAESVGPGPELRPTNADKIEQALAELGDYQITGLPESWVEDGLAGWPLEHEDDWYSYVCRWYVSRKNNQAIYFEYETYVSDCASTEEVARMSVGDRAPVEIVTVQGCTGAAAQNGANASVAWVLGDAAKGVQFKLYSEELSVEELLEIANSVRLLSGD